MTSTNAAEINSLFETILTTELLDESAIENAKELFDTYSHKNIIIDSQFIDKKWKLCDEYSNLGMIFEINKTTYKKYYENVFGITVDKFIEFLKSYILLTMGKNVLLTLRQVVNDIKKLFRYNYLELFSEDIKLRTPYHITEFITMLPSKDDSKKDMVIDAIESIAEYQYNVDPNCQRNLASFKSYFKFNDLLIKYWNSDLELQDRMFYYPIYLWWRITAIIPLRPREYILTPRACVTMSKNQEEGKYYITLRRNKLKGSIAKVNYNIDLDYTTVKYEIPKDLAEDINFYIKETDQYENNELDTLFRTDPHYANFQHKKHENSRFYTYVNLNCALRLFYEKILHERMNFNIIKGEELSDIDLTDTDIEYIYLGDTRHLAMINIIAEGGTPTIAMQLAYHSDISISSHYYANISQLIECRTYMKYMKAIKENNCREFLMGSSFYPFKNKDTDFVLLENNGRCYSTNFSSGDLTDCKKARGDNGELGYCFNCTYFRKGDSNYFITDDDIYRSQIEKDCNYLRECINRVRNGMGYQEEISQALLRLENSSTCYSKYYTEKLIIEEVIKNGKN